MTASTPTPDDPDTTANVPDGSGTDSGAGDAEQDTSSGGAPEDPAK